MTSLVLVNSSSKHHSLLDLTLSQNQKFKSLMFCFVYTICVYLGHALQRPRHALQRPRLTSACFAMFSTDLSMLLQRPKSPTSKESSPTFYLISSEAKE